MKPILQKSLNDCGLACLAMIAAHHGLPFGYQVLLSLAPPDIWVRGLSMRTLRDIAEQMGLEVEAVRCDAQQMEALKFPVIIHTTDNHYVVVEKVLAGSFVVIDPRYGRGRLSAAEFAEVYSGMCLHFSSHRLVRRMPAFAGRQEKDVWQRSFYRAFLGWAVALVIVAAFHAGFLVAGFAFISWLLPPTPLNLWIALGLLFGTESFLLGRVTDGFALRAWTRIIKRIVRLCSPDEEWLLEIPGGYVLRERVRWMAEQLYQSRAPFQKIGMFFTGAAALVLYALHAGDFLLALLTTIVGVAGLVTGIITFSRLDLSLAEISERRFIETSLNQLTTGKIQEFPKLQPGEFHERIATHGAAFTAVTLFAFYWCCTPHLYALPHLLLAGGMQFKLMEWWSGATTASSSWRIIRHCYEHLECMRWFAKAQTFVPANF